MLDNALPLVVTRRAAAPFLRLLAGCALLWLALGGVAAGPVSAQSAVERTEPPMEETISVSPEKIGIWFAEPLLDEPGAITIQLVASTGAVRALGTPAIYDQDPRHASAAVEDDLAAGTYSVLWTARFAGGQTAHAGAFAFRIDGAGAGAATAVDAFPALWAVVARILTLLGLALALGGLMAGNLGAIAAASPATGRGRRLVILAGGALALIGTIAEPVFAALLTVPSPPLTSAFAGYATAWWPRVAAVLVLVIAGFVLLAGATNRGLRSAAWLIATIAGAVALVATCSTGLALNGAPASAVATISIIVVQAMIVLLTGFAVQMALAAPPAAAGEPDHLPRPARRAMLAGPWLMAALAMIALVGAIILGALLLPNVPDLIERLFGQLLLLTGLFLVAILLLAVLLRRGIPAAGRWGLVALAALSLGSATVLALVLPPSGAAMPASLAAVSLIDSVPLTVAGEPVLVHLQAQPVRPGENTFIAWLTTPSGEMPPVTEQPDLTIELRSLSHDTPPITASPVSGETGIFTVATAPLANAGWWQATATMSPGSDEPATANFFLLVPDPNIAGYGPDPTSSPAANAVFERGLAAMTSLHQVRFSIHLGSGAGTFGSSEITIDDGSDGSPRGYHERAATYETVIVGDRQWIRFEGEDWSEREAGYIFMPADWGDTYERATGFALGPIVELGGEPTQIVTFWLPRQEDPRQEPAWFAWWVGTETGQVHRETMISNRHYMVYNFTDFNQPVEITPPTDQ